MSQPMFKYQDDGATSAPWPDRINVRVDGWPITAADQPAALAQIAHGLTLGRGFSVVTMNLDHLVKLRDDAGFRTAYEAADIITADGAPVAWLARRENPAVVRTTGADLVLPLSRLAAKARAPVFLFGSTEPVLRKAAEFLKQHAGAGFEVAGMLAPSRAFSPTGPEADRAIELINASGARLVYIALGAPKQEMFAAYACARGTTAGFVSLGASLDFLAGTQSRAPLIIQRTNLEWLWRLLSSPRRLGLRYLRCALLLAKLVAGQSRAT